MTQLLNRGATRTAISLAVLCMAAQAHATENGPTTPFGVYDFGAGFMPQATDGLGTVGIRTSYYSSKRNNNAQGNSALDDFKLTVKTAAIAYVRMSTTQWLGGNIGFGTVVPFLDMDARFSVATPVGKLGFSGQAAELGDIQVQPLIIQWHTPSVHTNLSLQIQAPTGDYDKNRLVNPGSNHWTYGPTMGVTYISQGGFELSSNLELDINTRNNATNYRSGIEYKQEFAAGQHLGAYTLGLGGYWYQQISDDSSPGLSSGNRARALAIGPAISFFEPGKPLLWLHAYKEFNVANRSAGYTVAARVAYSF
ncbi:SphA family protein [Uliginosibacterium sediminicola]|uniref:Transporter n=1 Tax=Uliginosibacterium sediminicola TaxID=2024550 RepID=A0ABU9YXD1_9RHOO